MGITEGSQRGCGRVKGRPWVGYGGHGRSQGIEDGLQGIMEGSLEYQRGPRRVVGGHGRVGGSQRR